MIRPPFRPPLTHKSDKPAAANHTKHTDTNGSCCGRQDCCGETGRQANHDNTANNPNGETVKNQSPNRRPATNGRTRV
jgi:hypothetical protein